MVVKSFRGLLADGGQDLIRLQTIKGKVGYRIIKFDLMLSAPGVADTQSCVKIFKAEQASVTNEIDFTDATLLAAGVVFQDVGTGTYSNFRLPSSVIFESEIFNQDIFVTNFCVTTWSAAPCNYYIELEVVPLDDAGAEYTTLKDMRQSA